jgi:hypothetical protein
MLPVPQRVSRAPNGARLSSLATRVGASYDSAVLRVVRVLLLLVLLLLVLGLVVAAGSPETGPVEKPVLAVMAIALLGAAVPIHRIGARS